MIAKIAIGVLLLALVVNGVLMYCCFAAAGEADKRMSELMNRKEQINNE